MSGFGKPRSEPPPTWDTWKDTDIKDAGHDVYYMLTGDKASGADVLVYHWHTPDKGAHRWALSGCGLHDLVSAEPLTLSPSLACEDGCPSHGHIVDGTWRPC